MRLAPADEKVAVPEAQGQVAQVRMALLALPRDLHLHLALCLAPVLAPRQGAQHRLPWHKRL